MLNPTHRRRSRAEPAPWTPRADLYRTRRGWVIKMDLAGVRPTEIEVVARGASLVVSGCRRDELVCEGWQLYHMEIAYNRFERVIEFPESLDGCELRSQYRGGMLLVEILREPKHEEA